MEREEGWWCAALNPSSSWNWSLLFLKRPWTCLCTNLCTGQHKGILLTVITISNLAAFFQAMSDYKLSHTREWESQINCEIGEFGWNGTTVLHRTTIAGRLNCSRKLNTLASQEHLVQGWASCCLLLLAFCYQDCTSFFLKIIINLSYLRGGGAQPSKLANSLLIG